MYIGFCPVGLKIYLFQFFYQSLVQMEVFQSYLNLFSEVKRSFATAPTSYHGLWWAVAGFGGL